MTIINDPDYLDRFQVAIDPVYQLISLRGSGTFRNQESTGSGTAEGNFIDSTTTPGTQGVVAGDILAVTSDDSNDGGTIGHYKISQVVANSGLILDRTFPQTGASGISYQIYSPGAQSGVQPSLADGVTMQALYSFLKEEWRNNSLSASGEDLIKFTFPMVSITSEQFEIGGVSNANWDFADDSGDGPLADESPRNLIRTGGWASINNSGQIIEHYPSIVTLGFLETSSQVYYQLTSSTTDPNDFVLTGPVNQSIRTLETIGGVTATGDKNPVSGVNQSITFAATSPNMDFGATDMYALGFTSGELIQIRQSASNNGLFTITASGAGATTIDVAETVAAETVTALASPMTDNRDYLVLRVRTKAKSYGESAIADIGVTQINTIVNRFPLAEVDDPAILLDDGSLEGDGAAANLAFQAVDTQDTGTNGDFADPGNGTITFDAATDTPTFNTGAANNVAGAGQVFAGDTIEITGPTSNPNIGVYEIQSVTDDDTLVLFPEPGRAIDTVTNDGALQWTARTQRRTQEASDGVTADNGAGLGTFTSVGSDWTTAAVASGDFLRIKSGNHQGYYKIETVVSSTNISVNTLGSNSDTVGIEEDGEFGADSGITFDIVQKGMNLQYKRVVGTTITGIDTFSGATFTDAAVDATYVIGGTVVIAGTTNNNGTYLITDVTGTTVTVVNSADPTTAPTFNAADNGSGTATTEYGFIRKLGDYDYSFNWKLEGNGGDLAECFQYLQKQLRAATDIDLGDGVARGDITDLLMTFASPNGTTLNLFIDNVDQGQLNNLTQQDINGTGRRFPFLVALKIALNANIRNANTNKIVVFYSDFSGGPNDGDEFGTTGAVIVQDSNSQNMVGEDVSAAELTFTYDYTAGGSVDVPITIVCITDDTGQYVQTTATLVEANEVNASLVAGLERNYSNP